MDYINIIFLFTLPVLYLISSFIFKRKQFKINSILGFRTQRSMSSKENWIWAQKTMGKWLFKLGLISLLISFIAFIFFFIIINNNVIQDYGVIFFIMLEGSFMIILIYNVEKSLKKFDAK